MTGCSESPEGRSSVVTGKVTLGGAPVSTGTVLFMTEGGHAATAELEPDGTYTVQCRPDHFKVAVTPPSDPDPEAATDGNAPKPKSSGQAIPRKYRDLSSSGLNFEVKEGRILLIL